MAVSYRTVWISDLHLGNPAARADDLLQFLRSVRCERLYLVGDIVDLQRMKARPHFPETHRQAVQRILQIAIEGTKVTYIPGNHDFEFRDLVGRNLCGIDIMIEAEHHTASGRRLLVTHGDLLDREIREGNNLTQFGAAAYGVILQLDAKINELRRRFGKDHVSLSRRIKDRLASANEYIRRFEEIAASHARRRGYDGIVCGHIHKPNLLDFAGVRYANDGDWVEHQTALAEAHDGSLSVLCWEQAELRLVSGPTDAPLAA